MLPWMSRLAPLCLFALSTVAGAARCRWRICTSQRNGSAGASAQPTQFRSLAASSREYSSSRGPTTTRLRAASISST